MTTYYILPGTLEVEDNKIIAGLHTGPDEFTVRDLRYIEAPLPEKPDDPSETVLSYLGRVYEETEGCIVLGNFRPKGEPDPGSDLLQREAESMARLDNILQNGSPEQKARLREGITAVVAALRGEDKN